jgi:hypothetical protein
VNDAFQSLGSIFDAKLVFDSNYDGRRLYYIYYTWFMLNPRTVNVTPLGVRANELPILRFAEPYRFLFKFLSSH